MKHEGCGYIKKVLKEKNVNYYKKLELDLKWNGCLWILSIILNYFYNSIA